LKRTQLVGLCLAIVLTSGCADREAFVKRNFHAHVTGAVVESASSQVPFSFDRTEIDKQDLVSKLPVTIDEALVTKDALRFKAWYPDNGSEFDYQVLLGGFGAETIARGQFIAPPPVFETITGSAIFWGYRPGGQSRMVRALALGTVMVIKKEDVPFADFVYLISGGPVDIECLYNTTDVYQLRGEKRFVTVTYRRLDGAIVGCDFSPVLPPFSDPPPPTGDPIPSLGPHADFLSNVKAAGMAAGVPAGDWP